jgi:NADPH-dependent glutamate synthase beta subunit-like oxidoreductase
MIIEPYTIYPRDGHIIGDNRQFMDNPATRLLPVQQYLTRHRTVYTSPKPCVAVIGAGPTGLHAAYDLTRRGYEVVVFDTLPKAGGALVNAIPATRFSTTLLDHDIQLLKKQGVNFRLQTTIGHDLPFSDLQSSFGAILLATGNQRTRPASVSGETLLHGIIPARHFLQAMTLGPRIPIGEQVVVIGGDRTALYAARAALQAGARTVQIIYEGPRAMMSAPEDEIQMALQEGVHLQEMLIPRSFIGTEEATLQAVCCYQTRLTQDLSRHLERCPGTKVLIPADTALVAGGEYPDLSFLPEYIYEQAFAPAAETHDDDAHSTRAYGLFVAGGLLYGPGTIAQAMKHGRQAARIIDAFIRDNPSAEVPDLPEDELAIDSASFFSKNR